MKELMIRQVTEKTNEIRQCRPLFLGVSSWVKYIRVGMGMTLKQLSQRAGLSISTINQLEKNEALDKVTLGSLKKAAKAMNSELIYAIVPKKELQLLREEQAMKKAQEVLGESHLQMEYEDQAVTQRQLKGQLMELQKNILASKRLWDEE